MCNVQAASALPLLSPLFAPWRSHLATAPPGYTFALPTPSLAKDVGHAKIQ